MNSCVNEEWAKIKQHKNWDVNFDVVKQSSKEKNVTNTEGSFFCSARAGRISRILLFGEFEPPKNINIGVVCLRELKRQQNHWNSICVISRVVDLDKSAIRVILKHITTAPEFYLRYLPDLMIRGH